MALPKRNRRTITVDDTEFHWCIGARSDHRRGTATIQHSSGSHAKLIVDPIGTLRPSDIAESIRFAARNGWIATMPGADFWVGFCEYLEGSARFVLRNATDDPYWSEPWNIERAKTEALRRIQSGDSEPSRWIAGLNQISNLNDREPDNAE